MSIHPQTPQSPAHFSPSTADPISTLQSSTKAFTTALPTPAHSVNGNNQPSDSTHDANMTDYSPQKRKRAQEDTGEQVGHQKKLHVDDGLPSLKDMHEEVGAKYLVLQRSWQPTRPLLSEDLFEMYDLTALAGEVARVLPDGTKNAMRKTYKGQIKKLGLAGHFDSVKKEANDPDGFLSLVQIPSDEWNAQFVLGNDIQHGFRPEVQKALKQATTMARGTISKDKWDSSVLADFAATSKGSLSAKAMVPSTPIPPAVSGVPRPKAPAAAAQEAARPRRSNKKRSYGDCSFEGYGDGYDDETGAETGYSTGEGEGTKRRKKVPRSSAFVIAWGSLLTLLRTRRPFKTLGHLVSHTGLAWLVLKLLNGATDLESTVAPLELQKLQGFSPATSKPRNKKLYRENRIPSFESVHASWSGDEASKSFDQPVPRTSIFASIIRAI